MIHIRKLFLRWIYLKVFFPSRLAVRLEKTPERPRRRLFRAHREPGFSSPWVVSTDTLNPEPRATAEWEPLQRCTARLSSSTSPPRSWSWQETLQRIWKWSVSPPATCSWPSEEMKSWIHSSRPPSLEEVLSLTSTSLWSERRASRRPYEVLRKSASSGSMS